MIDIVGMDTAYAKAKFLAPKRPYESSMKISADLVIDMVNRIKELNDIVSVLTIADETGYVDGEGFVTGFNQITDDAREFLLAHNLEQQNKGVKDFFNSVEPYIQRGKSKMWRIDDIILEDYFMAKEGTK